MSGRYPEIVYTQEGMREGMQIEDAHFPIDAKVALKPEVYEGCISPWKEPSTSPYRERVEQGLPPLR